MNIRRTITVVAILCASVVALVGGMVVGGAATPSVIADVGNLVRWGLPAAKLLTNAATAVTVGTLVFACFSLPFTTAKAGRTATAFDAALTLALASAIVWTVASVAVIGLTYASIDTAAFQNMATAGSKLWLFVTEVSVGQNLAMSSLFASVATVLIAAFRGHLGVAVATVAALCALIPIAQSGHAAGTANHNLAVGASLLHISFASIWIGGLVAYALVEPRLRATGQQVLARYSSIALVSFLVVAVSGVFSAVIRVSSIDQLVTGYGALLLAKALMLVVLGLFGVWYRTRLIRVWPQARGVRGKVIACELGVMGATSGLAVALAQSAPPTDQDVIGTTAAEILTGEPLPPEITLGTILTQWSLDPIWFVLTIGAAWAYLVGAWRLHKRGDRWPVGRTVSWVSGCAVLFLVTNGGLNRYQEYMFSVHMTAHMMLTMVIPILLVLGAPVTLIARAVAKRHDGSWGMREWVLWAVHTPYARFISHPVVAAVIFAASLWVFYFTPIIEWAVREHLGHEWMTIHFLISGYLFVQALIGIDPGPHRTAYPVRLLLLLATMAFHAFFGVAIMGSTGLIDAAWYGAMGRTWGPTPLEDQQIGGGIAWSIGEIPTVILALVVAIAWARSDQKEAKRLDRNADRTHEAELEAYNAMLARMGERDDQ